MRRPEFTSKKIAVSAVMLSMALVISLIESFIPPIIPAMPYAKIGFANIILTSCLLLTGYAPCLVILICKCVFVAIFSGNMFSLAYSLPAGIAAYTLSAVMFKCDKFGVVGVSAASSILHNFVQLIVATFVIGKTIWLSAPYLLLLGAASGIGIGVIVFILLKSLPAVFLQRYFL